MEYGLYVVSAGLLCAVYSSNLTSIVFPGHIVHNLI